jgi:hypothetical protein
MSLEKLFEQLNQQKVEAQKTNPLQGSNEPTVQKMPPIEQWNPPYCGEIDIQIKANGDWYYGGTVIKRLPLVKLFASVLLKEQEGDSAEYFLITPVEKVKITVEDAPFILTQWRWLDLKQSIMEVETNLGDSFVLDKEHSFTLTEDGFIYVNVRRNLLAKVHRNVYYQWIDLAEEASKSDSDLDNTIDGIIDNTIDGSIDNAIDGSIDNTIDGSIDNAIDGSIDNAIDGSIDNAIDGSIDNAIDGSIDNTMDRNINSNTKVDADGCNELSFHSGQQKFTLGYY